MKVKFNFRNIVDFNRGKASFLFKETLESGIPTIITNHGKAMVVVLSVEEYERISRRKLNLIPYELKKEKED